MTSKNKAWHLLFIFIISHCQSVTIIRNGIDVLLWKDVLRLNTANQLDLSKPFIIAQSPSTEWTLLDNNNKALYDAFDYYSADINVDTRTSDCLCFENRARCYRFASTFKYLSSSKRRQFEYDFKSYSYWDRHEIYNHIERKFEKCIHRFEDKKAMRYILDHMDDYVLNNYRNTSVNITSRRVSFNVINGRNGPGELMIDAVSMKFLEHINIFPYFDVFNFEHGMDSLTDMLLWFGSNNYRLIRHSDESDNLFFVLNGTKQFVLSPPMLLNDKSFPFVMYPFNHPSSRSAYPIYDEYDDDALFTQYAFDVQKDEVLYLPAGWFHEVTNDEIGSFGLNLWFNGNGNRNLMAEMLQIILPVYKHPPIDEFDEILYFMHKVTEYFDNERSEKKYGFLFTFHRRMYPILDVMRNDNLIAIGLGLEWMQKIVDIENILKCYQNKRMYEILEKRLSICPKFIENRKEWDYVIGEFVRLFESVEHNFESLQNAVAGFLETVLYYLVGDAVFTPILTALYNI